MKIENISANKMNFGLKFSPEANRRIRGILGDALRRNDVDFYEKSLAKVRDIKKLFPTGELAVQKDFQNRYDIFVLKRPDSRDYFVSESGFTSDIKNIHSGLNKINNIDKNNRSEKYSDELITKLLDKELPY